MKVRLGFVSNSSNTSFYLNVNSMEEAVKIMAEVAMIDYFADYDNIFQVGGTPLQKSLEHWFDRLEKVNLFFDQNPRYEQPVRIPYTCNNETTIWKVEDGKYAVDTCNNTSWYDYIEEITSSGDLYFEGDEWYNVEEMKMEKKNG